MSRFPVPRLLAGRIARFRRARDGAAAIEFAIVAVPFFAIVFAIMETALIFFAGQVLDSGVSSAARLIRTGQAQMQGLDEAAFKQRLCAHVGGLLSCPDGIKLDVRTYQSFGAISLASPIDQDGNLTGNFVFQPGGSGDIVVVRAFYEWPAVVPIVGVRMGNLANGNRLLASAATFRNEPF